MKTQEDIILFFNNNRDLNTICIHPNDFIDLIKNLGPRIRWADPSCNSIVIVFGPEKKTITTSFAYIQQEN